MGAGSLRPKERSGSEGWFPRSCHGCHESSYPGTQTGLGNCAPGRSSREKTEKTIHTPCAKCHVTVTKLCTTSPAMTDDRVSDLENIIVQFESESFHVPFERSKYHLFTGLFFLLRQHTPCGKQLRTMAENTISATPPEP